MARKYHKVGEREFVEAIASAARSRGRGVRVGIGDDAAVVDSWPGKLLLSTDTMVEGTHFKRGWLGPAQLGRRAARVAVSDLAAMGGGLRYLLLSLELPTATKPADALAIVRAVMGEGEELGGVLVGGNVARAPRLALTVTVVGSAAGRVLTRAGAGPGDELWVSGHLGQAAAGRRLLAAGKKRGALVDAFRSPPVRLALGRRLAGVKAVTTMMDISDGLVVDLETVCRASAVAVTVNLDSLPISRALRASSARPRTDALAGGEDYELLFAVRGQAAAGTLMGMAAGLAAPLTRIGWFDKAGTGSRVRDLRGRPLGHGGYRHF